MDGSEVGGLAPGRRGEALGVEGSQRARRDFENPDRSGRPRRGPRLPEHRLRGPDKEGTGAEGKAYSGINLDELSDAWGERANVKVVVSHGYAFGLRASSPDWHGAEGPLDSEGGRPRDLGDAQKLGTTQLGQPRCPDL